MSTITRSLAHRTARNQASRGLADTGPAPSSIRLYTAPGGTFLGKRTLAKPCGAIDSIGRLTLLPAEVVDLAEAQGGATWATWCDGNDLPISEGRVTDPDGNYTDEAGGIVADPLGVGPFVLGGSVGTTVYLGGLIQLYSSLIG